MHIKISGKVIKGKGRGSELGFSTANIELKNEIEGGVYAGTVVLEDKKYKAGIFVGLNGKLLEAHLVGFSGDLYGKEIVIEIGNKIREVMKFKNDDELKRQIKKDIGHICSQAL